ncbi:hypothetical protein HMPREF9727_01051 [Treponema denticola MYR-T]|uniref:Lipoprotein n=1 Tax=Treponema denticola H1-T TaxID=999431 RepID=M2B6R0_TREDN|nr:hypothetical protein [Treponema denticola]EMB30211.1 hypothetical protein HMPREF9727_01051 [Treponema denticola MYR-T]EMB31366.1 hypothetical protein HMPREF9725_01415 [Treponema denticola H1-T]
MKKTLFFILVILVLMVSSCNLFLKEEYGELILSFDGSLPDGARALDSKGLPVLSSSPMKIDIIRENGYTITRELGAEEPKSLVELVPVGEKIKIIVTAINPSGQWSGRAFHTVTSGQNHVRVLLNKNISGLKNLLFTQKKTDDPSTPYNLTLYMNGKEINAPQSQSEYSFARDSLGRPYVRYKPNDTYLARYTSEGELDGPLNNHTTIEFLANDYTTGTMYGLSGSAINKIEENLTLTSPFPTSPPVSAPFAVDNGIFTWADIGSSKIYLWKAGMASTGVHGSFSAQATEYNLGTNDGFAIKDIFIRNGYVYVLFAGVQSNISHGLYSLGAVLKWKIGTDPASGNPQFEGPPVVLGKSAGSPVIENGVLKNYDYSKSFYGAVKVIGFDEENIYIADDGFDAAYFAENPHIVKNRNRIATLNIATNTLSFSDERTAKWYNEWKEWRKPNTKTLLWEKDPDNPPYMRGYWTSTNGAEASSAANKLFEYSAAKQPTDVFCYDQDGNLYIMYDDAAANKYVRRFALKEDGSYEKLGLDLSSSLTSAPISAIAVDISEGQNSLYYVYTAEFSGNTHAFLQRRTWNLGDTFDHASPDLSYLRRFNPNTSVTALAANKDGVFVGIKETYREGGIDKYRLKVQKYAKINNPAPLHGELTLVDNAPEYTDSSGTPIDYGHFSGSIRIQYGEAINNLKVFDGVLYALSSKSCEIQKDRPAYFTDAFKNSGILYKIGSTNGSLSENAVVLAKKDWDDANKIGYGFYRFIAVKYDEAERIKLIIASDGAWGEGGLPIGSLPDVLKNTDKVLEYDLKGSLQTERNSGGSFSKTLKLGSGFDW